MMTKITEESPEYYALNCLTDEEADVAASLGLRKPRNLQYVAKKCGKSEEETKKILDRLGYLGVIKIYTENNETLYFMQIFAPGTLEMMVGCTENVKEHPEIAKAFEAYTRGLMETMGTMLPYGQSMMRVIPIESAIASDTKAIPYDKISYYLDKYDTYSVSPCSCRRSRRLLGEGCGHLEDEMCVQLGSGAEYFIKTGKARQITRQEAEEIFRKAEENGLMHQMPNLEGAGESAAICNCCGCSCFAIRISNMFNCPDAERSNYHAEINQDNCVACGQCVENCPVNAIKLGQKLCTKTPLKTEYYDKVRNTIWGKDKWNVNYRENREDTLETGTAPCKTACPAHIAVQGYIRLASQGRYKDALELIKKENPFPAICGRICPHKCEDACTRGQIDKGVAIDEIKKFIADKDKNSSDRFIPTKKHDYTSKHIAVIGSGPAGLSAAYYLAVDGYDVTVFEKEEKLGGMMTLGIPSFRLEKEVVEAEIDILRELGVKFITGIEVGKDKTIDQLKKEGFDGFYLAIGASQGRKLNIEGEDGEGVILGVDFLKNVALNKQKPLHGKVVVIGGGNVAIDVARTATRVGAESVNMYSLEKREEMPALEEEIEEAESENVIINNGYGPKRIIVKDGKVTGIEFKKCVSVFNEEGKFAPKYDENDVITVEADYILVSIGQRIEWGKLLEGTNVKLNKNNTVSVDEFYVTGESNIIAGGDCVTGPKFAIDAIASGKEGAISIHRAVWPGQTQKYGRDRRKYISLDKDNLEISGYDNVKRQRPLSIKENHGTFKDTRATFTEEQMKLETSRCLGCGAAKVDTYMCIGCGQCTTKCKFDAIKLVRNEKTVEGKVYEKLPIEMAKHAIQRAGKIIIKPITPKK
ncbi:MAG: FAD-dependent oxidoreductase [Mollicutes bacterium]|nr:FAD-dependent oxidoreductase [Mollicutes bacterium]MDD7264450.1 FAD-dependent oxidoreductase [bacterium]